MPPCSALHTMCWRRRLPKTAPAAAPRRLCWATAAAGPCPAPERPPPCWCPRRGTAAGTQLRCWRMLFRERARLCGSRPRHRCRGRLWHILSSPVSGLVQFQNADLHLFHGSVRNNFGILSFVCSSDTLYTCCSSRTRFYIAKRQSSLQKIRTSMSFFAYRNNSLVPHMCTVWGAQHAHAGTSVPKHRNLR